MNNCPECNKTMGLHDLFVAGLCPSCAGKYITQQAKLIKEIEVLMQRAYDYISKGSGLQKEFEQALKKGECYVR